ncbi:MAG: AAA family ATPase [Planctomycetaceae bacterium]|nr:AAA family ATPase [Planctomycetaceae bacterium]
MSDMEKTLAALREAVRLAPDNVPLLRHYVETLLSLTRFAEAEQFLKQSLAARPRDNALQLLLAEVFYRDGKNSHALAIVESICNPQNLYPPALVLHAKLLYRSGDVRRAVDEYKRAIAHDESLEDPNFASLLGIRDRWEDDPDSEEMEVVDGKVRQGVDADAPASDIQCERPKMKFADVGGMESVKEQIRIKIIYPITHAEMFAAYGKKVGGGILLYGPPGCGKTFIARATAGEVNSGFISIGINDVLDMWLGNSERNLHGVFENARRNRPCVLFFDEVDALGASRSDLRQSAGRTLVNQFLAEMDGAEANNEGLLILGATNAPWQVDAAFRRPGRFDRVIFVPPPDEAARAQVLELHLAGKPNDRVDVHKVASRTAEFSGADLKAVVDMAVETKLQHAIKTGNLAPINTNDLLAAAKTVRPTTKEWFATARNHAVYANQGGAYDDILTYLKIKK